MSEYPVKIDRARKPQHPDVNRFVAGLVTSRKMREEILSSGQITIETPDPHNPTILDSEGQSLQISVEELSWLRTAAQVARSRFAQLTEGNTPKEEAFALSFQDFGKTLEMLMAPPEATGETGNK